MNAIKTLLYISSVLCLGCQSCDKNHNVNVLKQAVAAAQKCETERTTFCQSLVGDYNAQYTTCMSQCEQLKPIPCANTGIPKPGQPGFDCWTYNQAMKGSCKSNCFEKLEQARIAHETCLISPVTQKTFEDCLAAAYANIK